jgi:hypothetical protein
MSNKIVFFNVAWMKEYRGGTAVDDTPKNGGSHVEIHGEGGEIYNFQPADDGCYYGYVEPQGKNKTINIKRIDQGISESATSVDGVLVVWTAKNPKGGKTIVGFYENATIYKVLMQDQKDSNANPPRYGYYAKCQPRDAHLIPVPNRLPRFKHLAKVGHPTIFYANVDTGKLGASIDEIKAEVFKYFKAFKQDNPYTETFNSH